MTRNLRFSAVFASLVLFALSTFGQNNPQGGTPHSGTVVDVDTGNRRLEIESDSDRRRVSVESDLSTSYHGFGTMIAGKPEIFTGSSGFSNVRLGDRVRVEGTSRSPGVITATNITLLGREVAASQVGVGQTRTPTSVSTQIDDRTTANTRDTGGTTEGTIRSINLNDNRLVIQTPQRRMITVRIYRSTPVTYRGETYRVTNLEVGDEIRVEAEPRTAQADEITARRIEVTESVQDSDDPPQQGGTVTIVEGRITRTEPGLDYIYLDDDGRGEVRVDMRDAQGADGGRLRARDMRVGEYVEISGSFNRVGDIFLGSTVRYTTGPSGGGPRVEEFARFSVVTITATITETLEDASTIGLRERDTNRTVRLWVTDDFIVRTRGTTYTNAGALRVNDQVVVQAFRDAGGNLVAQTIRLRNR